MPFLTYAERFKTAMGVGAGVSGEFQGMQGLIMASAGISDSLQGELQGH